MRGQVFLSIFILSFYNAVIRKSSFSGVNWDMSRTYHYVVGKTGKLNYTKDSLEKAIRDVTFKGITLRKASEKHGVPRNTISSHVACCNVNTGIVERGGNKSPNSCTPKV